MNKTYLAAAIFSCLCFTPIANAVSITIDAAIGLQATGNYFLNFNDLPVDSTGAFSTSGPNGSATVVFSGTSKGTSGSVGGVYVAPETAGGNGTPFGIPTNGSDATPYLTSGSTIASSNSFASILFADQQYYLGLLWGSIDPGNALQFYNGDTLVGTVTGSDVLASISSAGRATGEGTYVNINFDTAFTKVVATSEFYAFEFDNVSYATQGSSVPDGGLTVSLLGVAFAGLDVVRRRFSKAVK